MSHALAAPGAVLALAGGVIRSALGARLVLSARPSQLVTPRGRPARPRAVPVAAIAAPADVELVAAPAAVPHPKILHPTSRWKKFQCTPAIACLLHPATTRCTK